MVWRGVQGLDGRLIGGGGGVADLLLLLFGEGMPFDTLTHAP